MTSAVQNNIDLTINVNIKAPASVMGCQAVKKDGNICGKPLKGLFCGIHSKNHPKDTSLDTPVSTDDSESPPSPSPSQVKITVNVDTKTVASSMRCQAKKKDGMICGNPLKGFFCGIHSRCRGYKKDGTKCGNNAKADGFCGVHTLQSKLYSPPLPQIAY